jgi:hypothetical protein
MMPGNIILSTAYFPPAEYFSLIKEADTIFIENEENYIKQTYRNRCKILASNGVQILSIPVKRGITTKTQIREVEIDYSKRWQQVHLRALMASYNSSPFFQYYFEDIRHQITRNFRFLLDLNDELLDICVRILRLNKCVSYTNYFEPPTGMENDFRQRISPRIPSAYHQKEYYQVFGKPNFVSGLSILDLLFNMGPESSDYL